MSAYPRAPARSPCRRAAFRDRRNRFRSTRTARPATSPSRPPASPRRQAPLPARSLSPPTAAARWSAYSDVSWLSITGNTTGSGNYSLPYAILANTSAARTGSIHVGGQLFTVTQQAVAAPSVVLSAVVNGADYAQGAVSPGGIVAVFGSNIAAHRGRFLHGDGRLSSQNPGRRASTVRCRGCAAALRIRQPGERRGALRGDRQHQGAGDVSGDGFQHPDAARAASYARHPDAGPLGLRGRRDL